MTNKPLHSDLPWRPILEVSSFYVVEEKVQADGDALHNPPIEDLSVRQLDASHIPQVVALTQGKNPADALQRRFDRGDNCLAVFRDTVMLSFSWVTFGCLTFGCYALPLKEHEAYLFDMFVDPAYRGKGLAGYTRQQLYRHLNDLGRTRLLSISLKNNKPALRFKEKLGARIVDQGVSVKLCNRWRFGKKARISS